MINWTKLKVEPSVQIVVWLESKKSYRDISQPWATLSSVKKVTSPFIILPFAYLSWILGQVQPSWSWSLPEGVSLSSPWDQEAFRQN